METRAKHRASVHCLAFLLCMTLAPDIFAQAVTPPEPSFAQAVTPPEPSRDSLYIIQPNDLLRIFVYNEPELSGQVSVRPDGRISLPLVQDMEAAGLNPGELKQRIEERLQQYIDVPNVTVMVEAIRSYRVYVTGQVGTPGALMAEKPISVLQAISLAGGLLAFANPERIVIIRSTGEDSKLFRFHYSEVIRGENFNQNMLLRSGDVVVVP